MIGICSKGTDGNCQGFCNVGVEPMFPADVSIIGTRIITFYIYESICTARDYTNESSVIPVAMAMSDNIVRQPAALTRNTHNNRCSRLRNPLTAASSDCKEVDENRFGAQSYCFGRYKNWRTLTQRVLNEFGCSDEQPFTMTNVSINTYFKHLTLSPKGHHHF